ncbi:wax ester/triacylglycerol synthase domain-containing protein [Streptomyces sp. NEAU-NA10]|uniref:wax ester/triacylglycerol synthase domain-containing protein n=1 Tax=Streptomyces sp. NEAU-NA10 TaxID=3416050 RepID=UPI003CC66F7A
MTADRIAPLDRALLSYTRQPVVTTAVFDLKGPAPTLDAVRDRVRSRLPGLPVLCRTAGPRSTRWGHAEPDLELHVRHMEAAPGGLDDATRTLIDRPLPSPRAPLWDLWLQTAPAADRHRLCLRFHHGLTDGVGHVNLAAALLCDGPVAPFPRHRPGRPTVAGIARLLQETTRRPNKDWPELSAPTGGPSTWSYADVDMSQLRGAARRFGGTVNDVYLTALAGAFRAWRRLTDSAGPAAAPPDLPVCISMSVRRAGDEYIGGNYVVAANIDLPVSTPDPLEAARRVTEANRRLEDIRYRNSFPSPTSLPVPTALLRAALTAGSERSLATATYLPFPGVWTCFGTRVAATAALIVLTCNTRCFTTLHRINGNARFTAIHDSSLPHAERLPSLWLDALAELADAGPGPRPGRHAALSTP